MPVKPFGSPIKRPRVAIVGCGWFARAAHIPALRQLSDEGLIEVSALCSRSSDSLEQAQFGLGLPEIKKYTDIRTLLADSEVDVVDLLLPISSMPEAIRASLRAGKHVISEKPCAPTVRLCLDLLAEHAAQGSSQLWAVAENWRFKRTTRTIEAIVRSGELGSIQFADFHHASLLPQADRGWRNLPDYPGGHLLDSGVHFVALLRQIVGEIENVYATICQRREHLPPADTVSAVMSFANGAEGLFRLSFAADELNGNGPELHLVGTKGSLLADFGRRQIVIQSPLRNQSMDLSDDTWVQGGVYELLRHFFESLSAGEQPKSSAWDALRDVAVIEAMLESSRLERPIKPTSLYSFLNGCSHTIATYQGLRTFKPRHLVECSSIEDVQSTVREATAAGMQIRPMGVGYSWSPHLLTRDICLRINSLNQILEIDKRGKTVRVEAGARLGDVTHELAKFGMSLPSLSFISDVTVGGAIATGTHGTSPKWGTLSDFVRSMTVVLASGEVKTFGPDSSLNELCAARVAVGMLGVIVEVELEVIDMPWVRHVEIQTDLKRFASRRSSILLEYDHVWAHWILGENQVRVQCLKVSTEPDKGIAPYVRGDNAVWESPRKPSYWRRGAARAKHLFGRIGKHSISSPKSQTPSKPQNSDGEVYFSMQYGLPISQLETAVDQIASSEFASGNGGRIVEMKFLKGEGKSFLGSNADRDSVLFNTWWSVDKGTKYSVFDGFEAIMRGLCGRPHWGKLHRTPDLAYMKLAYPRWDEFEAVRARLDPGQTFSIFRCPDADARV